MLFLICISIIIVTVWFAIFCYILFPKVRNGVYRVRLYNYVDGQIHISGLSINEDGLYFSSKRIENYASIIIKYEEVSSFTASNIIVGYLVDLSVNENVYRIFSTQWKKIIESIKSNYPNINYYCKYF